MTRAVTPRGDRRSETRDTRPRPARARGAGVKATALGICVGLVGALLSLTPPGVALERDLGLGWLFSLRGHRTPPDEVVVVSVDQESSRRLSLPKVPRKWPRSLHGRLVTSLAERGAAAVVFDVIFSEARDAAEDRAFARDIERAGNVVLFDYLEKETFEIAGQPGDAPQKLVKVARVPPVTLLADAAAAHAPFPLPKVPVRVSQAWLFAEVAGGTSTLPVAALEVRARPLLPALHASLVGGAMPPRAADAWRAVRERARENGALADHAPAGGELVQPLLDAYAGPDSRYVDFYGPPRSIRTVPYHRVVAGEPIDLTGAIVFVGFAERLQPQQRDGFYTVYSQDDGLDVSGVEIAATVVANLIEGRHLQPLPAWAEVLVYLLLGCVLSLGFVRLPTRALLPGLLAMIGAYVATAHAAFSLHAAWLPLAIPVLIQTPLALLAALLWRFADARRERHRARDVLRHYVPGRVAEAITAGALDPRADGELLYGVCLVTDAEQYTRLAEGLPPDQVGGLLNRYYGALFDPVTRRGGFVSDVVGDSMLAIWTSDRAEPALKQQACMAALDIIESTRRFATRAPEAALRTRLGVHGGEMLLTHVGAGEHYEYRAVGDIINTGSRIEGLNKTLGTRALVSADAVDGVRGVVAREIGRFRLRGKREALTLLELVGREDEVQALDRRRLERFALGLAAYRARRFTEAAALFTALIREMGDDGPARYYLALSEHNVREPPQEWDDIIGLSA